MFCDFATAMKALQGGERVKRVGWSHWAHAGKPVILALNKDDIDSQDWMIEGNFNHER